MKVNPQQSSTINNENQITKGFLFVFLLLL